MRPAAVTGANAECEGCGLQFEDPPSLRAHDTAEHAAEHRAVPAQARRGAPPA